MSRFEVWAPGRHQVDVMLVGPETRWNAYSDGAGRGRVVASRTSRRLAAGTRYLFSLDGGPGRPDPALALAA